MWSQLGVQAQPLPTSFRKERFRMKDLLSLEDVEDGPRELMGKDGERLRLTMFSGEFGPVLYCLGISREEKDGSLGEGPLQMDVADFLARGASDLTCGFRLSFNLLLQKQEEAVRFWMWHAIED
jgi:hypothetical protein